MTRPRARRRRRPTHDARGRRLDGGALVVRKDRARTRVAHVEPSSILITSWTCALANGASYNRGANYSSGQYFVRRGAASAETRGTGEEMPRLIRRTTVQYSKTCGRCWLAVTSTFLIDRWEPTKTSKSEAVMSDTVFTKVDYDVGALVKYIELAKLVCPTYSDRSSGRTRRSVIFSTPCTAATQ